MFPQKIFSQNNTFIFNDNNVQNDAVTAVYQLSRLRLSIQADIFKVIAHIEWFPPTTNTGFTVSVTM
ncbi:hypothetical protein M485_4079 [Yersinia pestis 14735]|nr:hypothetical protein M485_4079 [Yersinia pestis 14735]